MVHDDTVDMNGAVHGGARLVGEVSCSGWWRTYKEVAACAGSGSVDRKIGSVTVDVEDHVAGMVSYFGVGVGGTVI